MNDTELDRAIAAMPHEKVTKDRIEARILSTDSLVIPNSTVTICHLVLENGYSVLRPAARAREEHEFRVHGKRTAGHGSHALWIQFFFGNGAQDVGDPVPRELHARQRRCGSGKRVLRCLQPRGTLPPIGSRQAFCFSWPRIRRIRPAVFMNCMNAQPYGDDCNGNQLENRPSLCDLVPTHPMP